MDHALCTYNVPRHSLEDSLRLGQSLHLEFEDCPEANGAYHLWGICPGSSIMVSASHLGNVLPERIQKHPRVKARLFVEQLDAACAFRTEVSLTCDHPVPYLHLNMPVSVMTGEIRKNHRAKISLPAEILCGEHQPETAKLIDASICGCRIRVQNTELKIGDCIRLNFTIRVFGITQTIRTSAMIRSRAEESGRFSLGARFLHIEDQDRIALHSYLSIHS